MDRAVLGVDVGGTDIKSWHEDAAGVGRAGTAVPTPAGDPTGARTADAVARLVAAAGPLDAVGVAVPGIVDDAAGVCRESVNLGWRDVRIGALVEERTGLPVTVAHDVRAGASAERLRGAGADRQGGLLFAPLGTGLAVASVDDTGTPVAAGYAGEVGQLRYRDHPHAGLRVEEVASAGGLARHYGAPGGAEVLAAVRAGDPRAAAAWAETVEAVAEVLAWAIALTAPGTVVVGGGLARAGAALLDPLRASVADRLAWFPEPVLLPALLGTEAAAIGVAGLARRRGAPAGSGGAQNAQLD